MRHFKHWKRWGALLLVCILAVSLIGCGGSSGTDAEEETEADAAQAEATTEEIAEVPDYSAVYLPDDFDTMVYPLESVMLSSYVMGTSYFTEEDTDDADFWAPMAILCSMVNADVRVVAENTDDGYLYVDDDVLDMLASSLYDAYTRGDLEFPELSEEDVYAINGEEDYGLLDFSDDLDSTEIYITACTAYEEGYVITTELWTTGREDLLETCDIGVVPTSYEDEDNLFAYSISSVDVVGDDTEDVIEETTAEEEEGTGDETDEAAPAEDETSVISQNEALSLAQDYYGAGASYSYKGTVTVGEYEYYDFSVVSDDISSTDVLVSQDGRDVIGGVQNEDGSWSFDQ